MGYPGMKFEIPEHNVDDEEERQNAEQRLLQ